MKYRLIVDIEVADSYGEELLQNLRRDVVLCDQYGHIIPPEEAFPTVECALRERFDDVFRSNSREVEVLSVDIERANQSVVASDSSVPPASGSALNGGAHPEPVLSVKDTSDCFRLGSSVIFD